MKTNSRIGSGRQDVLRVWETEVAAFCGSLPGFDPREFAELDTAANAAANFGIRTYGLDRARVKPKELKLIWRGLSRLLFVLRTADKRGDSWPAGERTRILNTFDQLYSELAGFAPNSRRAGGGAAR